MRRVTCCTRAMSLLKHFSGEFELVTLENELSAGNLDMPINDDPRAPYKVFEGDELKGTHATRAEARRQQQQLESQAEGSKLGRYFVIKDNLDQVVS